MPLYLLCIDAKGAIGPGRYSLREGQIYTDAGQDTCSSCGRVYVMLEEQPIPFGVFSIAVCSCGHRDQPPGFWSWDRRRFIQLNEPDAVLDARMAELVLALAR